MRAFLPDTSCMVAAVCAWHEHHHLARRAIEARLEKGESMILAAPALIETYAVLTRLPPPHRLAPEQALELLESNFMGETHIVALDSKSYQTLLHQAPENGVSGGRTYDAVIAECASKGGATTILTFNESDFRSFASSRMTISVPE
jgi:predicted nucleic acid-binding protein